jgi:glycosyltransferase involved in cell wall biosynthesis
MRSISIIVPVYKSENILENLVAAIELEREKYAWDLELIMVEDGSLDGSYAKLLELKNKYPYIKAFKLSRNFGHQAAVRTGFTKCINEYVAVIDDDMQDPPNLLESFFKKLDEGFDVVYGVRKKRKEGILKVASYAAFYRLLQRVSDIEIPLDSGDFCVMKSRVVKEMLNLNERNLFLRGMRSWVGFKHFGFEYERAARFDGDSNYTISKLFKIAFDGIFSFSSLPLRATTFIGGLGFFGAILYSLKLLFSSLIYGIEVKGFITITLLIIFFGSLQLISIGIIGEYIARIYNESKQRPHAIISESSEILD